MHIKINRILIIMLCAMFPPALLWGLFLPWLWPYLPLLCLAVGLYCYSRDRSRLAAWLLPATLAAVLVWWEYALNTVIPYVAALDFSRLGIEEAGIEVSRARMALLTLPLLPAAWHAWYVRGKLSSVFAGRLSAQIARQPVIERLFAKIARRPVNGKNSDIESPEDKRKKVETEQKLKRIGLDEPEGDITVCYEMGSGKPVKIRDIDRYLHMLVVGSTGVGKTSRVLKPMLEQEILNIRSSLARRVPRGMTVIEPKGDLSADIAEMSAYYNVPCIYIDPLKADSARFNPLEGDPAIVAEAIRTVLRATFGKQEAFYSWVQEVAARNVTLLLKYSRRNNVTMQNMLQLLRDHKQLREEVNILREFMDRIDRYLEQARQTGSGHDLQWLEYIKKVEPRIHELISYFDMEVLNEKIGDKIQQFALGLRLQVEDIVGNEYLGRVVGGASDINMDAHLNRGGIFVVNTAMSHLGKLGDTFGQFLTMHFQNAVFRRQGTEFTRARHMLVIDEAHRYVNPDFERLLAMGRSFRCECVLALQNISQFSLEEKRSFQDSVLNLCRNKIVFGGMDSGEAKYFAAELGETETVKQSVSYSANLLFRKPWEGRRIGEEEELKSRFDYTALMELPVYQVVYRIVKDGALQPPGIGEVRLSKWDTSLRKKPVSPALCVKQEEAQVKPVRTKNASEFKV